MLPFRTNRGARVKNTDTVSVDRKKGPSMGGKLSALSRAISRGAEDSVVMALFDRVFGEDTEANKRARQMIRQRRPKLAKLYNL